MRAPNSSGGYYSPGDPPSDPAEIQRFLRDELQRISGAINALAAGHFDEVNVAPAKPRKGDVRLADGTSWNPGSGRGIYIHNGTTWILIKAT